MQRLMMWLILFQIEVAVVGQEVDQVISFIDRLPSRDPIVLSEIGRLSRAAENLVDDNQVLGNSYPGKENSGIVKSRSRDDLYWVHNDSGDDPKIYSIHADGSDYKPTRYAGDLGVTIAGAINVDWEDIAVDSSGNLIVADVGNNSNDRRDLIFYVIPEPSPVAGRTTFLRRYFIRYPDQRSFPATRDKFNFDCEAVFTVGDTIYCFSKNRSDRNATLYRLDEPKTDTVNTLTKLETICVGGQVVGADASTDGLRLVVITYDAIWLFERTKTDESFFSGRTFWAPYDGNQIEAVCFGDTGRLKLIDETTGTLYEVDTDDLTSLTR